MKVASRGECLRLIGRVAAYLFPMASSLVAFLRAAITTGIVTAALLAASPAAQAAQTGRAAQASHSAPKSAATSGCPNSPAPVICVDLTHQRLWVQKGGKTTFLAVPIRSGRRGYATRTGTFHVFSRAERFWSKEYNAPMPYSQFFSGGQAIHGSGDDISRGPGSHGCVNLRTADARRLWSATRSGEAVYVWGRKPGT